MNRGSPTDFTGKFDKVAVALSGLCLVHCLFLPLVIALFPIFGFTVVEHATFHKLILIVVIPTTLFALGSGYLRHRHGRIPTLGLVGVLLLVVAAFAVHAAGSEMVERLVTIAGGLTLALAHIQNFRVIRASRCHRHSVSPV